jgi:hypothetical protein
MAEEPEEFEEKSEKINFVWNFGISEFQGQIPNSKFPRIFSKRLFSLKIPPVPPPTLINTLKSLTNFSVRNIIDYYHPLILHLE